jgi:hypothetical protein
VRRNQDNDLDHSSQISELKKAFNCPPLSACPRVWWHWMNGSVTHEGVRLDLEWMNRVGIGGVQNFEVSLELGSAGDTSQPMVTPLRCLTPEWKLMVRYAVELANELDLEFAVASSAGWSESGGPWVQPRQAMKKLVWSETIVNGLEPFTGLLALPPQTTGPFQGMPLASTGAHGVENPDRPMYYADVAVIAYRLSCPENSSTSVKPQVTSSAGDLNFESLGDNNLSETVSLPIEPNREAWIQISFSKPQRIQAITSIIGYPIGAFPPFQALPVGSLEASEDGFAFCKIAELPRNDGLPQTVSFPPVSASHFRTVLKLPEPSPFEQLGYVTPPVAHQIAQLVLHTEARVNRFEDKAGYSTRQITENQATPPVASRDVIGESDIVDLTHRMTSDGSLNWTPLEGQWAVLRFGYTLTGRTNNPASPEGTGLEVDKLNREHVQSYIERYLDHFEGALGPELMGGRGLQYVVTDSYEAGAQNWTEDMLEQFEQRRGYSALQWLLVLAGRVIGGAWDSDRFLWDFRKTLGELIAEAHYGQISESLRSRGLGRYGESHEVHRAFIGDGMQVKKTADIPMGAIWAARPVGFTLAHHDADIRESASVAHIYGQNIAAAEAFTSFGSPYGFTPESLKPLADRAMAMGLNRFVIHTSVHQPDSEIGPGIGLGPFGQWFTRKEVWAEMAGSWVRYLSRSCYLLQQGRFVADIAYLYGEDTNITSLFGNSAPAIPDGYNFDFVNSDAVLNDLSVQDGQLVTRSGMHYRLLALDESTQQISVPVLRKLRELVRGGAMLAGTRPIKTPSLMDSEADFVALVGELWGDTPGERTVGEGKVFSGGSLKETLGSMEIPPDIEFSSDADPELRFVHRTLGNEGDLYFVSHGNAHPRTVVARFRVSGRKPELWRADTGTSTPVSYHVENDRTVVSLRLEANDAVFIVFHQPTSDQRANVLEPSVEVRATLSGPWDVRFPPGLGAPSHAQFAGLNSWSESADAGIKYFSGIATYSKTVYIRQAWLDRGSQLHIDLGEVKYLAEVSFNDRSLGVLWKRPFAIDITEAVQAGENRLEIKVANLWPNRLIGDQQSVARKIASATYNPFKADSPLLPSGLLGPVILLSTSLQ